MKKKYFAPEIEELKMDEPFVLNEQEASQTSEGICTTDLCNSDTCKRNYD